MTPRARLGVWWRQPDKHALTAIQAAEAGRTINRGALLRLLQVYEPGEDPVEVMAGVIVSEMAGSRRPRG